MENIALVVPRRFSAFSVVLTLAALAGGTGVAARGVEAATEIEAAIRRGGDDCALRKPQTALSHFADDVVLSYPGVPDQGIAQLRAAYPRLCSGGPGSVERTEPMFEEVTVNGGVALVRIVWRTRLHGAQPGTDRYLRDLQIWRRDPAGWRFFRGVHYPLKPEDPIAAGWLGRPASR